MTTYREVTARDLTPGDAILHKYHDASGTYREEDVPVVAVKVFTRKVRITWVGGWGQVTVPASQVYGVRDETEYDDYGVRTHDSAGRSLYPARYPDKPQPVRGDHAGYRARNWLPC